MVMMAGVTIAPNFIAGQTLAATKTYTDWYDVSSLMLEGSLQKGLSLANQLIKKNALDYEGYYKIGEIHLMMGDRAEALKSFKKAYDIFPIPKYRDAVEALK